MKFFVSNSVLEQNVRVLYADEGVHFDGVAWSVACCKTGVQCRDFKKWALMYFSRPKFHFR